ncbi:MAG: hypothetical protein ACREGI_00900 [Candidatus Levyibacteriota bacterium]
MDTAQTLLVVVIVALTVLLVVLGLQVFFILRELKKTVEKANKVLDDTGLITHSVSGPISNLSTIITGVKAGSILASILSKKKKKSSHEE